MDSRFLSLLFGFCGIFTTVFAGAEDHPYYMWRDSNGVLNISEVRPRDKAVDVKTVNGGETPELSRRPGHEGPQGKTTETPAATSEDAEVEKNNATTRLLNCQIGHMALDKLNANKFIFMRGKDGLWRKLTPEERDAQVANSQKLIADNCDEEQ